MSRTIHPPPMNYEYWASRYHNNGEIPGKFTKIKTHHKERQDAERELRNDPDNARKRLGGGMN